MRNKWIRVCLIGAIALGALMAIYVGWARHDVEQENRQVELVLEWNQIKEAARRENISEADLLNKFKGNITGVVFKEPTLNDLKSDGRVLIKTGMELLWEMQTSTDENRLLTENGQTDEIHDNWVYLIFADREVMSQVSRNLIAKAGSNDPNISLYRLPTPQGNIPVLGTSLALSEINNIGIGFVQQDFDLLRSLGLNIIPQIRSWRSVTGDGLAGVFEQFQGMPVTAVFFNDNDLPGVGLPAHRQNEVLQNLADQIKGLGVPAGMVEFFPQKGITTVAKFNDKNLVRMHSIPDKEMPAMTQRKAIDRYTLAVTDRDIRVLLVRLFPEMGLKDTVLYLTELKTSLADEGFQLGSAHSFGTLPFSRIYLLVIGLGVAAGGALLLDILGFRRLGLVLAALGFLGFLGLLIMGQISIARKGMALVSVIVFPTLSIAANLRDKPARLGKAVWLLVRTSFLSLIGALFMVGLLADKTFMYTLDQFMGVKLAHLIPVLLILVIFWFLKDRSRKPLKKIMKVLEYPVTVKYVVMLSILAVVLLIYIMRTGNEGAAVSAWELAVRARLDDLLAVRPRTKEFLIGHPLMLLLFYLGYKDKVLPILAVAVIGQVSLVNTFAHIHTPLVISLIRTFNGLWLGILMGVVLIGIYKFSQRICIKG